MEANMASAPMGAPKKATTLDEPVWTTLWRDVKMIGIKLWHVLIPRGKAFRALREWDLWGPLVFCLVLALILHRAPVQVFVIIWVGGGVIAVNSILLGGKISFFQGVCVMGYCVFPLLLAAIISIIATTAGLKTPLFRGLVALAGFVWSTFASVGFLSGMVPPDRKALAVYPVALFFLALAWMVTVLTAPGVE